MNNSLIINTLPFYYRSVHIYVFRAVKFRIVSKQLNLPINFNNPVLFTAIRPTFALDVTVFCRCLSFLIKKVQLLV